MYFLSQSKRADIQFTSLFDPSAFPLKGLFGVLLLFLPDSPVWLRQMHRYEEAEKSSRWLKLPAPSPASSAIPVKNMDQKLAEMDENEKPNETELSFFTRPVMMPLGIGLSLLVLQQISGIDAIIFFTVEIFHASGTKRINQ